MRKVRESQPRNGPVNVTRRARFVTLECSVAIFASSYLSGLPPGEKKVAPL